MTSTVMARIQDGIRISTPGSLDGMIRMELYNVLKEFFQRTDCWLLEVPVYIEPWSNDYQVDVCQNAIVNRLISLERPPSQPPNLSYVPSCPPQYLAVTDPQQSGNIESQNPLFRVGRIGILLNAGTKCPMLRIWMNPQVNETWIATFSLNVCDPTDPDGFSVPPDWVIEKYYPYITSGVISRMMLQPGKPYSSLQGAQFHGRKLNEGIGIARTEVRRMFTYGSQRWHFPTQAWNAQRPRMPSGQIT
jgi:hypothetical protein